ncbi:uncharacterized protein SPPG_04626 [Spizellomyces punctatus DAOM BR117]|uniref:Centrosomal protein of 19 kDa n=1 Tax=Spizellomyces punctatus (strain DAOM BR117) TaxID=645134 RepID=A0A0L0HHH5_SPIPD|nr:uncharacterized protein SPPG_04626 [Spizellomyces punctatus DAOM BR117]KND00300.1 hypothetical protein SPPG_04626 [Spizellomyces punctatus DAOM BR117]|eukprot:XP_016608339.1 hypothetical protein SPPG_04626 [Spizellomyces punctatus DAOM BR117]
MTAVATSFIPLPIGKRPSFDRSNQSSASSLSSLTSSAGSSLESMNLDDILPRHSDPSRPYSTFPQNTAAKTGHSANWRPSNRMVSPKKLAIRYQRPVLVLFYVAEDTGKSRRRSMPLRGLDKNNVTDVVQHIYDRHQQYLGTVKVEQVKRIVDRIYAEEVESRPQASKEPGSVPIQGLATEAPAWLTKGPSLVNTGSHLGALPLPKKLTPLTTLQPPARELPPLSNSVEKEKKQPAADAEVETVAAKAHQIDGNLDLNKLGDEDLAKIKKSMNDDFEKTRIKPGDPGYVYDVQKSFGPPVEDNEWDQESETDAGKPIANNATFPSLSTLKPATTGKVLKDVDDLLEGEDFDIEEDIEDIDEGILENNEEDDSRKGESSNHNDNVSASGSEFDKQEVEGSERKYNYSENEGDLSAELGEEADEEAEVEDEEDEEDEQEEDAPQPQEQEESTYRRRRVSVASREEKNLYAESVEELSHKWSSDLNDVGEEEGDEDEPSEKEDNSEANSEEKRNGEPQMSVQDFKGEPLANDNNVSASMEELNSGRPSSHVPSDIGEQAETQSTADLDAVLDMLDSDDEEHRPFSSHIVQGSRRTSSVSEISRKSVGRRPLALGREEADAIGISDSNYRHRPSPLQLPEKREGELEETVPVPLLPDADVEAKAATKGVGLPKLLTVAPIVSATTPAPVSALTIEPSPQAPTSSEEPIDDEIAEEIVPEEIEDEAHEASDDEHVDNTAKGHVVESAQQNDIQKDERDVASANESESHHESQTSAKSIQPPKKLAPPGLLSPVADRASLDKSPNSSPWVKGSRGWLSDIENAPRVPGPPSDDRLASEDEESLHFSDEDIESLPLGDNEEGARGIKNTTSAGSKWLKSENTIPPLSANGSDHGLEKKQSEADDEYSSDFGAGHTDDEIELDDKDIDDGEIVFSDDAMSYDEGGAEPDDDDDAF